MRRFLAELSLKALGTALRQPGMGGGGLFCRGWLNERDMRRTVRVTDKQPQSMGVPSREKPCLDVDNKLPPRSVIAAGSMADLNTPHPDLNSLFFEDATIPSVSDT